MSDKIPYFLKKDGNSLIFNLDDSQLIYYVPESYFERSVAESVGEFVNLMGVFDYTILNTKTNKNNGLHRFNFPTMFQCRPTIIEKVKGIKLTAYSDEQDYRLIKFSKGDLPVVSIKVPESVENAEIFYNMFIFEKLPNTIPYDELQDYFIENIHINGSDYGLTAQIIGIIVSEMCRDPKDITKLFRYTDMKNMNAYKSISIKQAPKLISPFASITSENFDESLVNAIINKNPKDSPLEKLLML